MPVSPAHSPVNAVLHPGTYSFQLNFYWELIFKVHLSNHTKITVNSTALQEYIYVFGMLIRCRLGVVSGPCLFHEDDIRPKDGERIDYQTHLVLDPSKSVLEGYCLEEQDVYIR